jgi:hypothetical protein
MIDSPVHPAAQLSGIQNGKSRFGSIIEGHQDAADPNAVIKMRRV